MTNFVVGKRYEGTYSERIRKCLAVTAHHVVLDSSEGKDPNVSRPVVFAMCDGEAECWKEVVPNVVEERYIYKIIGDLGYANFSMSLSAINSQDFNYVGKIRITHAEGKKLKVEVID